MDGIAYLQDLETENLITVQLPDQSICKANFAVDMEQAKNMIMTVKSVICNSETMQ
jgi:outer membrane usher protein